MNDDQLGDALRQALAPPPVRPDPWSGQKLRDRARLRQEARRRRGSALASVVVVLALFGGFFGLLGRPTGSDNQGAGDAAAPSGSATGTATRPALLGVPLSLAMLTARPDDGDVTDPPFLVVDDIGGYTLDGRRLLLTLTGDDTTALDAAGAAYRGRSLVIRAGSTVVSGPEVVSGAPGSPLEVVTPSERDAAALVRTLRLTSVEAGVPLGAGRLDRALQLYRVTGISGAPCVERMGGRLVPYGVAHGSACLRLAATPSMEVTSVEDLRVEQPYPGGQWAVVVLLGEADRRRLPSLGTGPADDWAFAVGGRPVGQLATEPGRDGSSFTIYVRTREAAELLVLRLRP